MEASIAEQEFSLAVAGRLPSLLPSLTCAYLSESQLYPMLGHHPIIPFTTAGLLQGIQEAD